MTGDELAAIVREHTERAIAAALAPVLQDKKALELRVVELEARPAVVGPAGEKGDIGLTGAGISSLVMSAEGRLVAHLTDGRTLDAGPVPRGTDGVPGTQGPKGDAGEKGLDGKDADVSGVPALIAAEVTKAMSMFPAPSAGPPGLNGKDGTSVTLADVTPLITSEVQKAVSAIPLPKDGVPGADGKDGSSVTVADIAPLITSEAQKAIAALPVPKDGATGPSGKDGAGVTDSIIDRQGHLLLTMSDGRIKDVGLVTGKDADPGLMKTMIWEEVAKIPVPKDGRDGKDGADGMTIDDVDLVCYDDNGWELKISAGGRTKSFPLSLPFDSGPWEVNKTYSPGAGVSWDGGYWIAKSVNKEQPGTGGAWRLVVRRGKQGKEGPRGKDGRDLTPGNTPALYS